MGKVGWVGCVRNYKGKLFEVGGKEVVFVVMYIIKFIRELELCLCKLG